MVDADLAGALVSGAPGRRTTSAGSRGPPPAWGRERTFPPRRGPAISGDPWRADPPTRPRLAGMHPRSARLPRRSRLLLVVALTLGACSPAGTASIPTPTVAVTS